MYMIPPPPPPKMRRVTRPHVQLAAACTSEAAYGLKCRPNSSENRCHNPKLQNDQKN